MPAKSARNQPIGIDHQIPVTPIVGMDEPANKKGRHVYLRQNGKHDRHSRHTDGPVITIKEEQDSDA